MTLFLGLSTILDAEAQVIFKSRTNMTRNDVAALSTQMTGDKPIITRNLMTPLIVASQTESFSASARLCPMVGGAPVTLTSVKFVTATVVRLFIKEDGTAISTGISDARIPTFGDENSSSNGIVFTATAADNGVLNSPTGQQLSTVTVKDVGAIFLTKILTHFTGQFTQPPFVQFGLSGEPGDKFTVIGYRVEFKLEFDATYNGTTKRYKLGPADGLYASYLVSDEKLPDIISLVPASGDSPEVIQVRTYGKLGRLCELKSSTTLEASSWTTIIPPPEIQVNEDGTVTWTLRAPYLLPTASRYYHVEYAGIPQYYQEE